MIYKEFEFNKLTQDIQSKAIVSSLFYGPNVGLSKILADSIKNSIEAVEIIVLDYNEIQKDFDVIISNFFESVSFFPAKKLIKIFNIKDKIHKILSKFYSNMNNFNYDIYIMLFSEETDIRSLRTLYENNNNISITPCYKDDEKTNLNQINLFCNKNKLDIPNNIKIRLSQKFDGDRLDLIMELEKILIYSNNGQKIINEDIIDVICSQEESNISSMVDNFLVKNKLIALKEIDQCIKNDMQVISITRSFLNHLKVLKEIKEQNLNEDMVFKKYNFFFKRVPLIKRQLQILNLTQIESIIELMQDIELQTKSFGLDVGLELLRFSLLDKNVE